MTNRRVAFINSWYAVSRSPVSGLASLVLGERQKLD